MKSYKLTNINIGCDDDFEPLPKLVLKKSKKRKPSGDVRDKKVCFTEEHYH